MTLAALQQFADSGGATVGDALFWFSRIALAVAGGAFILYVLVIAGLLLTGRVIRKHRRAASRQPGGSV